MDNTTTRFELPGFRFHPTEEELLQFYLRNIVFGKRVHFDVIGFLNIYRHDPWELPGLAKIGEREWYFFVPVDRKQSNGGRPNRTTEHGFWKATGSDRKVVSLSDPKRVVGLRKTLVFYKGRAPKGTKTDWVMNEYRLSGSGSDTTSQLKDIVLCKVYRKATSLKVLEQWAVEQEDMGPKPKGSPSSFSSNSQYGPMDHVDMGPLESVAIGKSESEGGPSRCSGPLRLPMGQEAMPQLQVPKVNDWAQDPQWAQICSPWVESILSQLTPCADILNF